MSGEKRDRPRHDEWGASWEAHRIHQLTLALDATPAQRLAWLEEAIILAHRSGALPKRPSEHGGGSPGRAPTRRD
jgi:hypothetical protein